MGDTARSKCKNSRLVTAITWSLAVGGCADGTGPESTRVTVPTESPEVTVIRQASAWPGAAGLFIGKDLSHPKVVALQPLVAEILSAYGNPHDNLGRARVLRDWVARTAIHPHWPFHPDGNTSNLTVLPIGQHWADVNPVAWANFDSDSEFWYQWHFDGYGMLDQLLGTLDPRTGVRANDGMMTHVQGAQYRIKDISDYHYVLCTYQDFMLISLWEAAGLHGLLLSTIRHDPAAVFIPELAKWSIWTPLTTRSLRRKVLDPRCHRSSCSIGAWRASMINSGRGNSRVRIGARMCTYPPSTTTERRILPIVTQTEWW